MTIRMWLPAAIVLAILASGCQPRQSNEPIVVAVALNDAAKVSQYLAEGGDPDFKSRDGDPLIYIAAGPRGGEEVASLLIKAGGDVNAPSAEGRSALHNAASWCDLEMIELLLDAGADVSRPGKNGESLLDAVCKTPEEKRDATIRLLSGARAAGE